jgi:hypothetical protein
MPFNFAFSFASSMASGTTSTPYTFLHFEDKNVAIVPIPQYKSKTVSLPVSSAPSYVKL